ncbi:phosphate ABC transporter substrate-binding protein PstS [Tunturiibacter lichenicola]|uniref:phosphate ABC transporter substrate-binding protein PstS n=1 Tax=Tunturiibacter lichenicola TaxID=2051959 RepID=UPI0021B318B5|nr:phosphate ABC transporter substrate-binding protein PstS [Edaphobacter lichenicola]
MKLKVIAAGVLALVTAGANAQNINGAGATFPYPIYSKWFSEYSQLHSNVKINYQSIGSGGGIRQVSEGTVDFGASDSPMTNEQLAAAKIKVMHIPTVLGAVVPVYNIPGINKDLNFSGDVIADIYLGKITKWSDPRIAKDNPGANLPDKAILPVYRSDGSGTTFIFTDFLSKVSSDWNSRVGKGASIKWPTGIGQKGNEGVSGMVRQSPFSFGYVELIYAETNKMSFGAVRNASGKFLKASTGGVTAAAAGAAKTMPADYRVSITNAPGADAYPISSFTWLLIPVHSADPNKAKALADFLGWMLDHGEAEAAALTYAPLPKQVQDMVRKSIATVK